MDNFIRCIVICILIALSRQGGRRSANYEPILDKMQTHFKAHSTWEAVFVYERKYEELVACYLDNCENPSWSVLLDDSPNGESLRESLALGISSAVAIGTSFDPIGFTVVIDDAHFSPDLLELVKSQWLLPIFVRFYDSKELMDITYPCGFDLTTTHISVVIENVNVTIAEAIQMEWKYNYHTNGECEVIKFSNYDEPSKKWQEIFDDSDYLEIISIGIVNNDVFFEQPGYVDINVTHPGVVTEGNGLEYKLVSYLGKKSKLSFVPKAIKLASKDARSTETWDVIAKLLDEKKIDVAISRIPTVDKLVEQFAYSKIYFTEHYYILSTTFSSSDYLFAVFQPLRLKVWALLLFMIFICGPLFLTMVYFTSKPDAVFTFSINGLLNSYFHVYRLFFGHATWNHHFCFSFNFFVLTWLCFGLMLIVGYNSTFTASISSGRSKWEINSLADLDHGVEKGYVNLVLNERMDGRGPFKEHSVNKNSIYEKILNEAKRRRKVKYVNLQAANLLQLLNDDDALIADLTTSYSLLHTLKDKNFRLSQQPIGSESYALFTRKGFRYIDRFDLLIRELFDFGSFVGWYDSLMKGKNNLQLLGNSIEGTIMHLEHIYGAFLVYCIGVGLAVFALISEAIYKCCKGHKD